MSKGTKNYFRHSIFMMQDPAVVQLIEKGGMAHYGRFCALLELMAGQEISEDCKGEYAFHRKTLRERLSLNEQSLNNWLTLVEHLFTMRGAHDSQTVRLSYPNILKYLGKYNSFVPNKRKENKRKENESKSPQQSDFDFEIAWNAYPKKVKKKESLRHFNASVKTQDDFNNLLKAIENYKQSRDFKRGFIQNASTFFNNWEDFVDFDPKLEPNFDVKNAQVQKLNRNKILEALSSGVYISDLSELDKNWIQTHGGLIIGKQKSQYEIDQMLKGSA